MNLLQSFDHDKLSVIALHKLVLELAFALGLSFEGSFSRICAGARVNRAQLYERKGQLKAYLEQIEIFGPGRPPCQPVSEVSAQAVIGWRFREAVLMHRLDHPGSLVEHVGGHTTYGDSFVRLVLDLRDTWDGSLEWFCEQVSVPYQTFRSWSKKDQAQPYQENQPRPSIMFPGPASNDVLQIVQDYKIWEGNVREFAKITAERLHLRAGAIYHVLKLFCMLPIRTRKEPRYRGSTVRCLPGSILVTDGKTVQVICTGSGEVNEFNWQGIVDQATACHTAVVITATECAQGVSDAFDASCAFLGREPVALVHDNKPIHHEKELREQIEQTTLMIPATPDRGQNKAVIEGEFGKYEQAVGIIHLDDTNLLTLKTSAVHEIIRAYTAGLNHAGRVELDGESRESVVRKSCPDPEKDRKFIAELHADHTKKRKSVPLPTKEVSRVVLDEVFERFGLVDQDSKGEIRDWLAGSVTPDSLREGLAIFGAKHERGELRAKHSLRYLVKVTINRQHENDLRRQEELLREFAEKERQAWLAVHKAEHARLQLECESAQPPKDLLFRLAENAIYGCLNLQRAFWEDKLKTELAKQRDRYTAVCNHIRRFFEVTEENRFTLISKLVAWENGLTA